MKRPFLVAAFCAAAAAAGVENLTVAGQRAPLAIDTSWPVVFGWAIIGDLQQATYEIVVGTDASLSPPNVVWDSGAVSSSSCAQIEYGGPPLAAGAAYFWRVSLTFSGGGGGASAASTFGVGLDAASWAASAVWLGGGTAAQASPALRRGFALSAAPVTRAIAYASGLGVYTLHLNGARVGAPAVLTPGWATVPTARVLADAYDVTALLLAGQGNAVGMRLGQAKYGYLGEFCAAADATCYAAVLLLRVEQGANVTDIATDASGAWQCAPSPIAYNHLFNGETYNASLETPGGDTAAFAPAAPWAPALLRAPNVSLISPAPPPITIMADVTPVSVSAGGTNQPIIAGGQFIIADDGSSPDVWWHPNGTSVRNFLVTCSPCAGVDACGALVRVPPAAISALTQGANFSCSMLPTANTSTFVFDLGRNMAGFCSLALPAPAAPPGAVLSLVHGEILDANGAVENTFGTSAPRRACAANALNCADQLTQYVAGAAPPPAGATYTPSFTFQGFRYVGLFGWPDGAPPPTTATLTCHQAYSRMEPAGGLDFNSTTLNQIQAAVVQTSKSNLFSIASDCPTREKRGWLGDAQVSAGRREAAAAPAAAAPSICLRRACANPLSARHCR